MAFGSLRRKLYAQFPDDLRPSILKTNGPLGNHRRVRLSLVAPFWRWGFIDDGGVGCHDYFSPLHLEQLARRSTLRMECVHHLQWLDIVRTGWTRNDYMSNALLFSILAVLMGIIPLCCNLFPKHGSFLFGMRYYAGIGRIQRGWSPTKS